MARRIALAVLPLLVLGCGHFHDRRAALAPASPQSTPPVVMHRPDGSPLEVPVSAKGLALADALRAPSALASIAELGDRDYLFVVLDRDDGRTVISLTVAESTSVGRLLLRPGERIALVPWAKTELARGLDLAAV